MSKTTYKPIDTRDMRVVFLGTRGRYVARIFTSLIHLCRMNPFVIERGTHDEFVREVIENHILWYEYTEDDIRQIILCIVDKEGKYYEDKNGVKLVDKLEQLDIRDQEALLKKVFWSFDKDIHILNTEDYWDRLPLKQAVELIMHKNPKHTLEELLELVKLPKDL